MLKWMKNYYIGNDVKNPTRIRARITAGKFVPDIYVVTLSDNPGNILEILPAGMLVQRSARDTCPLIIGMARGKSGAIQMAQDVIEQVYTETGNFKIKEYLKNRRTNAAYIMADNKMDIDPSGDSNRADLSDPAASFVLSDQIQREIKKRPYG